MNEERDERRLIDVSPGEVVAAGHVIKLVTKISVSVVEIDVKAKLRDSNRPDPSHCREKKASLIRRDREFRVAGQGQGSSVYSPEYNSSTTVQSSLRGVPSQNFETASKMSFMLPFWAATSRRSLSKNSPCASSASVTPSVTRTRRSPACRL